MKTNAEVIIAPNTDGSYMIRITDDKGTKEVELTPTEFAKAVTGKMAIGKSVE